MKYVDEFSHSKAELIKFQDENKDNLLRMVKTKYNRNISDPGADLFDVGKVWP